MAEKDLRQSSRGRIHIGYNCTNIGYTRNIEMQLGFYQYRELINCAMREQGGASPGLILQADILVVVVFPANEVTCSPGMTKLHFHMDTRKLTQSKPNEERMRI